LIVYETLDGLEPRLFMMVLIMIFRCYQ